MCTTAERRREIERQLSQVKIAHPDQEIAGYRVGRSEFFFWIDGADGRATALLSHSGSQLPRALSAIPSPRGPPSGPQWLHEIKHDGYRLMARRDDSEQFRTFKDHR